MRTSGCRWLSWVACTSWRAGSAELPASIGRLQGRGRLRMGRRGGHANLLTTAWHRGHRGYDLGRRRDPAARPRRLRLGLAKPSTARCRATAQQAIPIVGMDAADQNAAMGGMSCGSSTIRSEAEITSTSRIRPAGGRKSRKEPLQVRSRIASEKIRGRSADRLDGEGDCPKSKMLAAKSGAGMSGGRPKPWRSPPYPCCSFGGCGYESEPQFLAAVSVDHRF